MIGQILLNTPVWVWVLLAALLVLGWRGTRPRSMPLWSALALPVAMGVYALFNAVRAGLGDPFAPVAWAAGAAVAFLLNHVLLRQPRDIVWSRETRRVSLPGSWLPMVLILGIFGLNYVGAVTRAVLPAIAGDIGFKRAITAVAGLLGGLFLSRAWRVFAATRRGLRQ